MRCSHDIIGSLYMESTCIEPPRIQPDGCGHLFPALTFAAFSQHAYLLLQLQQNRQEHRRDGVEVGRVAPGARMEAGLVHQLVERLAVLLPEGAAVVHPLVDDRLRMEAVRRDGAGHGHSPPSRGSMEHETEPGRGGRFSGAGRPGRARTIRFRSPGGAPLLRSLGLSLSRLAGREGRRLGLSSQGTAFRFLRRPRASSSGWFAHRHASSILLNSSFGISAHAPANSRRLLFRFESRRITSLDLSSPSFSLKSIWYTSFAIAIVFVIGSVICVCI